MIQQMESCWLPHPMGRRKPCSLERLDRTIVTNNTSKQLKMMTTDIISMNLYFAYDKYYQYMGGSNSGVCSAISDS